MEDYCVVLLSGSGEEARHINECYQWNVECVAEAYEACGLARSVAIEHTGKILRLVGNDTYRLAIEAGKAHDDVLGIVGRNLEELAIIDDCTDNVIHVVSLVGSLGNDFVERILKTVDRVGALYEWSLLEVVLRNVAEELADNLDSLFTVFGSKVSNARLGSVDFGTAESLLSYVFAGHGLYHLRTGEEHIGNSLSHDSEVGEGRRVNCTAGTRTEDS